MLKKLSTLELTFFLLTLVFLSFFISDCTAANSNRPDWAKENVFLVYGGEMLEYVPLDQVSADIEYLKFSAQAVVNLTLTKVYDDRGEFKIRILTEPSKENELTYFWEGYWNNQDIDFFIYLPPKKLQNLPLENITTPLGTYEAYKNESKRESGSVVIYWFEKHTGINLLYVALVPASNGTRDVIVMPLLQTNIQFAAPTPIEAWLPYIGITVIIIATLTIAALLIKRKKCVT